MCKTICKNRKVEFSGWQALERIPENCGCGGRAKVCRGTTNPPYFWVECEDCHMSTMAAMKLSEAEAIAIWNRAMGITHERAIDYLQSTGWMQDHDMQMSAKDINVPCKERTAKVVKKGEYTDAIHTGHCGSCGMHLVNTYDRYCPQCGAKLEWEEDE